MPRCYTLYVLCGDCKLYPVFLLARLCFQIYQTADSAADGAFRRLGICGWTHCGNSACRCKQDSGRKAQLFLSAYPFQRQSPCPPLLQAEKAGLRGADDMRGPPRAPLSTFFEKKVLRIPKYFYIGGIFRILELQKAWFVCL